MEGDISPLIYIYIYAGTRRSWHGPKHLVLAYMS